MRTIAGRNTLINMTLIDSQKDWGLRTKGRISLLKYNIFLRFWTWIQNWFLKKLSTIRESLVAAFHLSRPSVSFLYNKKKRGADQKKGQGIKQKQGKDKGIVTIAFLLVLIIVMAFILYFFKLCLALTHISIVQYISYSTARKLYLGDESHSDQKLKAKTHYTTLRQGFFSLKYMDGSANSSDWFYVTPEVGKVGDETVLEWGDLFSDSSVSAGRRKMFYGVGIGFLPRIFDINIPFLTNPSSATAAQTYVIMSFLGREPSKADCTEFFKARPEKIKQKYSDLPNIANGIFPDSGDNGC